MGAKASFFPEYAIKLCRLNFVTLRVERKAKLGVVHARRDLLNPRGLSEAKSAVESKSINYAAR